MRRAFIVLFLLLSLSAFAQERDPTKPPIVGPESVISLDSWAQELELTQIYYSEHSQLARLNGKWVKPGESVEGLQVTSIKPNSVVVERNSKVVEISLFKPIKQKQKGSPGAVQ